MTAQSGQLHLKDISPDWGNRPFCGSATTFITSSESLPWSSSSIEPIRPLHWPTMAVQAGFFSRLTETVTSYNSEPETMARIRREPMSRWQTEPFRT